MKLPYPDVPRYVPGGYGKWDLVKMPALRQYGYFTGPQVEPPYYTLVMAGRVWMTTCRMERESHSFHLSVARGRVMVCGVGMGLYLHNLCAMDHVREIVAVDVDAEVIQILRVATDFESWRGREKVRFICADARELTSDQIGSEPFDHLYVDIWPDLGSAQAMADTREIQSRVLAKRVGYWGQEIDVGKWHAERRGNGRPSALEGREFARWCRLPLGPLDPLYLRACCAATKLYAAKVAEERMQAPQIPADGAQEEWDQHPPRRSAG